MSGQTPTIDERDGRVVLSDLLGRQAGYTPGWAPEAGSAGAALLRIVARFAELLIEGLNQVPGRGQLAFLDRLGVELLPAQSARAPLVFGLLPDSPLDVTLPSSAQVAAPLPPPAPTVGGAVSAVEPQPVIFATNQSISLARARLVSLYSLDPGSDAYADHAAHMSTGFTLFAGAQPIAHAIYLGHDALLALAGEADVTLLVDLGPAPPSEAQRDLNFEWDYLSKDGWLPLAVIEDRTARLTRSGLIKLRKSCGPDSREETIAGHTSYWVRGRVSRQPISAMVRHVTPQGAIVDTVGHLRAGDLLTIDGIDQVELIAVELDRLTLARPPVGLAEGALLRQAEPSAGLPVPSGDGRTAVPVIDGIRARVSFTKSGLAPEAAFSDTLTLDTSNTFYPFGVQPSPLATCYLASKEVFQRRGAEIGVQLTLLQPGVAAGLQLSYEYFNGTSWQTLEGVYELRDNTSRFTTDGEIVFRSPLDWAPVAVNGERNYWLRIRIDEGDYGHPERLTIDPQNPQQVILTPSTLKPPVVRQISLRYSYQTELQALDHCLTFNDFHFADHSEDCRWPRRIFEPFSPVADRQPAVYFGFDRALPIGLISLYVAVTPTPGRLEAEEASDFVWEYASPRGWSSLSVLDETLGFRRSGMIQFVGPRDGVAVAGDMGDLFRVRARLKQGARAQLSALTGVWLNAVWASQRQTFERETLGVSDGGPNQGFRFLRQRVPVLEGEQIEVREWAGRGETWRTAVMGLPEETLTFDRDAATRAPRAVWVRYASQPHLYHSGPHDRHYTLERATGLLRFGDGRHGMIPPAASPIRATYGSGGGTAGNLAEGTINELRAATPYVLGVTNVAAAAGGAETEALDAVRERGAQRLRHRDRGISASDLAWLARDASPAVARARCLPLRGPDGPAQHGWVTVLLVPDGVEPQPQPTPDLLRRVQQHLAARVPAPVARRVRVLGPQYAALSVAAEVVLQRAEDSGRVEALLIERLGRFLHPLHGGSDGRGWQFGQPIYQSQVAALIEATSGVDYARRVSLRIAGELFDEVAPVAPDALLASGDHEIKVMLREDR